MNITIAEYNAYVKKLASILSADSGIDTPVARKRQCSFIRDIRKTFPRREYGTTWS